MIPDDPDHMLNVLHFHYPSFPCGFIHNYFSISLSSHLLLHLIAYKIIIIPCSHLVLMVIIVSDTCILEMGDLIYLLKSCISVNNEQTVPSGCVNK